MDTFNNFLADSNSLYFYIAIVGSGISLIMFALSFLGHDGDIGDISDGGDISLGDGGFDMVSFLSIRSLVAFFTFFGWAGYFWGDSFGGLVISLICGLSMMVITTLLVYLFSKMQQSGNIAPEEMLEKTGRVYLTIPGGEASGVVTVTLESCTRQIKAISTQEIAAGSAVKITKIITNDLFEVEKQ